MFDPEDAVLMPFAEVKRLAAEYQEFVNAGMSLDCPETMPMAS